MSESSLATEVCFLLGYNASATLLERAERRTTSQDLATPTESGPARSFPSWKLSSIPENSGKPAPVADSFR